MIRPEFEHTLCGPSSSAGVPPHGNGLPVLLDIVEKGDGAVELHARDSLRCLAGVLEGDSEERTTAIGRFGRVAGSGGVTDL